MSCSLSCSPSPCCFGVLPSVQLCHPRRLTTSPGHIFLEGRRDREHQGAFRGLVSAPRGTVAHPVLSLQFLAQVSSADPRRANGELGLRQEATTPTTQPLFPVSPYRLQVERERARRSERGTEAGSGARRERELNNLQALANRHACGGISPGARSRIGTLQAARPKKKTRTYAPQCP